MDQIKYLLISLRPYQCSKNLLVFAALIFSGHLFHLLQIKSAFFAFAAFTLGAGGVYIFNDIVDRREDVLHPEKKTRPIAACKLGLPVAVTGALIAAVFAVGGSFLINIPTGIMLSLYILLTSLYTLKLKQIVVLDVLVIAIGFVLRAVAGATAIEVSISPWLLVCTFFLALFLVIGKRRQELIFVEEHALNSRKILAEYNVKLVDQMIVVVTATTIVSYALYTLDAKTVSHFQTENLIYTIPFVILGIFRYFYLIYKKNLGGSPEKILFNDMGILATVILWIVSVGIIIY